MIYVFDFWFLLFEFNVRWDEIEIDFCIEINVHNSKNLSVV